MMTEPLWTLDSALDFVRTISPIVSSAGYGVAIGGSVLIEGSSDKDLDLVIFPLDASEVSYSRLYIEFCKIGLARKCPHHRVAMIWARAGSNDSKRVEVWYTSDDRRVDVFLLS